MKMIVCVVVSLLLSLSPTSWAENIDPANDASQFAYSENTGWLNAEPQGDGGPGATILDGHLEGYLWSENLGWINLNPSNYGGVTNDGDGNLGGYAWSENAGWINFAPSGSGVKIDPVTGEFSGTAWGENIGWISFRGEGSIPFRILTSWAPSGINQCEFDSDRDGDVDGSDLASQFIGVGPDDLARFVTEYGRTDCFE